MRRTLLSNKVGTATERRVQKYSTSTATLSSTQLFQIHKTVGVERTGLSSNKAQKVRIQLITMRHALLDTAYTILLDTYLLYYIYKYILYFYIAEFTL